MRKHPSGITINHPSTLPDGSHNPVWDHWQHKRNDFGISEKFETELLEYQDCKCGICKTPFKDIIIEGHDRGTNIFGHSWEVDHDPKFGTKKDKPGLKSVRGYLCAACNNRLAKFEKMIREGLLTLDDLRDGSSEWIDNMKEWITNPPAQVYINVNERNLFNALS